MRGLVGETSRVGMPWTVVAVWRHDPRAFTQGLAWDAGGLVESTGLLGRSTARRAELATGRVLVRRRLPSRMFGEGIAVIGDRVAQLTWRSGVGLLYTGRELRPAGSFPLAGEGWGLACAHDRVCMSDGTATLRVLDPVSLAVVDRVEVTDRGRPLGGLNDLEIVGTTIWANVYETTRIAGIAATGGAVSGYLELAPLCGLPHARRRGNVLNGIAWRHDVGRLLVTGKRWPGIFELEVGP